MYAVVFVLTFLMEVSAFAQHVFRAYVRDAETGEPLAGASAVVEGTTIGASADEQGFVLIQDVPPGTHRIAFRLIGYKQRIEVFTFPMTQQDVPIILLTMQEKELEEIVVSTTRRTRAIADEPTRVEAITAEELDEKSNMKPGDIRMLLNESTGIHVQQTSATTANASIRIQGLDGRYTQLLKDGFPLYSGLASGLSILQIAPLDLQQVEVIKGSSSTLYGGGAIAGIINLISKTPSERPELSFHLNGTTAGGLDLNGFYSRRWEEVAMTLFAARNSSAPYDPAGIDFSAIPKVERYTINPRLFFSLGEPTSLVAGMTATFETRLGGDMHAIEGTADSTHAYYERNRTSRVAAQVSLDHRLSENMRMSVKSSFNFFSRLLETPSYRFEGKQRSSFSEASLAKEAGTLEWIAGLNLWTDDFVESTSHAGGPRNAVTTIAGGFLQTTWVASDRLTYETGLRVDHATDYGTFVLPRISVLLKLTPNLTSRLGGGLGYKLPTLFTEESEARQFRNVQPLDRNATRPEKSLGANVDMNYRGILFDVLSLGINHLFFLTRLDRPLVLADSAGIARYLNADGHIITRGIETNITLGYKHTRLLLGYTFTDARRRYTGASAELPLTPRHRLNTVLMYEVHDAWRLGLEAYYFGQQHLTDGTAGRAYWICGLMAEKRWEAFSLYINFENFLDTRQTRFEQIYSGARSQPEFRDIYMPVDGFVINGGVKVRL